MAMGTSRAHRPTERENKRHLSQTCRISSRTEFRTGRGLVGRAAGAASGIELRPAFHSLEGSRKCSQTRCARREESPAFPSLETLSHSWRRRRSYIGRIAARDPKRIPRPPLSSDAFRLDDSRPVDLPRGWRRMRTWGSAIS
jgi:hypothetical protein